jgi:hypothetical protein
MRMSAPSPSSAGRPAGLQAGRPAGRPAGAAYGPTVAIAVTLAVAVFLALMSVVVLLTHPQVGGLGAFAGLVNQQNQTAKSLLYVVAFVLILPVAVIAVPRLTNVIAAGPNAAALAALSGALTAGLAAVLIVIRVSHSLPWGDGLGTVLAGVALWSIAAAVGLRRAASGRPWPALLRLASAAPRVSVVAGVLVFGTLLCVTSRGSLNAVPLALGGVLGLALLAAGARLRMPSIRHRLGRTLDLVVVVVLALAIPNVVVFHVTGRLPNIYFPPGVIQNQQDYLLGSTNQLLGGGGLLVNVPVSQYGVGLVYFLYGWFHLVPIGYGTLGWLDSVLTALFYIAGYCLLRIAGTGRLLAGAALAVAVVGLIYGLKYPVGSLPETGPLRFGLPMALVLAAAAGARWPRRTTAAAVIGLGVLGVSAIWAFEAFAYTVVAFVAIAAAQAWLRPAGQRRRWLARQAALAVGACVIAHLLLALATLLGTGRLPDWSQYLAYIRSFLLGGQAGAISYGFARWSPGLAVGGAALASAAAILLLVRRAPGIARRQPVSLIALSGTTAYAIALLSYTDNRSSTYLLAYVALPLLIAGALWLALLLGRDGAGAGATRRGGLAFALAVAVLVISAAWPSARTNFSETALAHAYPGGGLHAALHRLWHPPPIDPRAPEGQRLLDRYMPGPRALIVLPTVPDLAVEILMRSGRASSMFIGDPVDDSLVRSVWIPKLTAEVAQLRAGQRLLLDAGALTVLAGLRVHPSIDPASHPIDGGDQEDEWLLREIDRRFEIRPVYRDPDGLIVAQLVSRQG